MSLKSTIDNLKLIIRDSRRNKDVFFRAVFGENKIALLELYNALNGTNYDNPNDLEIVTIKSAIFITMKNDVAFMVAGVINLYEHQSTKNPNMPVRFLIYLGQEYQKLIERNKKSMYGINLIKLPVPKCVVFYNGDSDMGEEEILKLSDAYENSDVEPDVELTVRVVNVNYGHNKELMDKCKTLNEYAIFMNMVDENRRKGYNLKAAIRVTIEQAIELGILEDFLRKHKAEVVGMLLSSFDKKKYERTIREEGKIDILVKLVENGKLTEEEAAGYLDITPEEFKTEMIDYYRFR